MVGTAMWSDTLMQLQSTTHGNNTAPSMHRGAVESINVDISRSTRLGVVEKEHISSGCLRHRKLAIFSRP